MKKNLVSIGLCLTLGLSTVAFAQQKQPQTQQQKHQQQSQDSMADDIAEGITDGGTRYDTTSDDPAAMIREYVAKAHGQKAAEGLEIETDADGMNAGNGKAGTVSTDTAVDAMRDAVGDMADRALEMAAKETGVPKFVLSLAAIGKVGEAKDAAEKTVRKMATDGASFGYDGLARNECGKTESELLVINPKDHSVTAYELAPCMQQQQQPQQDQQQ